MANLSNTPDSHAPIIHEILFATAGGQLVDIPAHEFLESIDVELISEGGWKGSIVLFDADGDFLENLILASGGSRNFLFRWGWDDGRGIEQWPLFEGGVVTYTPEFTHQGTRLTIEMVNKEIIEAVLFKKTRSFAEGVLISDTQQNDDLKRPTKKSIIRRIAEDQRPKWKTVDENGRATIEASNGPLEKSLAQKDESDIKFIRTKLLQEAVNVNNKHMRFFFDRRGVMHFHSDTFLPKADRSRALAAEYVFARDAMGEVIRFSPKDFSFFTVVAGGGFANFTAVDSINGNRTQINSTREGGLPGQRIEVLPDATFLTPLAGNPQAKVNLIARDPKELERIAGVQHDRLRAFQYQAELEVRGTHAVNVFESVKVDYIKRNGRSHYLSGVYHVHKISHSVSTGGWTTSMELFRSATKSPTEQTNALKQDVAAEVEVRSTAFTQGAELGRGLRRALGQLIGHSVREDDD